MNRTLTKDVKNHIGEEIKLHDWACPALYRLEINRA
jgi:hypothetical protein